MYSDTQSWDLEALYASPELWEKDFAAIRPAAEKFRLFRGTLEQSPETLRDAIAALDDFERLTEKVYTYAHQRSDENTANNVNRSRVDRVETLMSELSETSAWFEPEIMAIPDELMKTFLASPALNFYRRSLEELLKEKPHTLSEPEERLLGTFGDVMSSSDKVFEMLNDADLDFGSLRDDQGTQQKLTHGSYRKFLESTDRKVRAAAFRRIFRTYRKFRNTFASSLDSTMKRHAISAKVRHYRSSLEQALFSDDIPEQVYTNLIDTVNRRLDGLHHYMEVRAKVFGLDKLDMYDLYNPLVPGCRREYSFNDAVELLKKALRPLGENYCNDMLQAFSQRWVDVPERKGKRSGAYSGGCYDSYPYLLLNFNRTLNDVFTLAHELGHSMHSYYSKKTQPYHYADYCIFAAEVASTTNECLLFEYLFAHSDDPKFRAFLLGQQLDDLRATLHRQTMFAEFELAMHRAAEQQIPLNADWLDENYYELNRKYYGSAVKADKLIAVEWARIPHFYYNYYVYQYSTGISAAIQFAKKLQGGQAEDREKYLGFLKAGGSLPVLEILRNAGVDLTTPAPIEAALDHFDSLCGRLEKELKKL